MTRAQKIQRTNARALLGAARALTRRGRHAEARLMRQRAGELLAAIASKVTR